MTGLYELTALKSEIQLLTVQIAFMALPLGNTIVINEMYMQSILNSPLGSPSSYHVLKSFAQLYLEEQFRDKKTERWLLEALSHYAVSEYNRLMHGKPIGETNSPAIANFFSGKRNSRYSSTGGKFRDFYRYGSLRTVSDYTKDPLIDYDYRTQLVYTHYGMQSIVYLKQIAGPDNFNRFLAGFLRESDSLTGTALLEYFINAGSNSNDIDALRRFMKEYPQTDYVLSLLSDSLF